MTYEVCFKKPIMPIEDRLFEKRMSEVGNGDQKVLKYLFSRIFYGRQEVPKYLSYPKIHLRLLHKKKLQTN